MLPPSAPAPNPPRTHLRLPLLLAGAVLGLLAAYGGHVLQQVRMAPGTVLVAEALAPARQLGQESGRTEARVLASGPAWSALEPGQRQALQPLAARWGLLNELQKRRWLALATTFATLPATEQTKLHNRMSEWASLSAQQRNQARLNFATANKLAPDNKRAQWEAYQALSAEEKLRLAAANANPRPKGAATALRPVPARKLVRVPAASANNANRANPPKIPPQTASATITPFPEQHKAHTPPFPVVVETAPVSVPSNPVTLALPPLAEPAAPSVPIAPMSSAPELPAPTLGATTPAHGH